MRLIELREHVVEQDDRHFSARMMHDVDDRKEKRHKNRLQLAARGATSSPPLPLVPPFDHVYIR
jgi:hypothetical protein